MHLRHQAIHVLRDRPAHGRRRALIGTTRIRYLSLDPATCAENWRVHAKTYPGYLLPTNRGAAYMDGRLYRGTEDGRVLAYDFKTGKRVWETTIGDARRMRWCRRRRLRASCSSERRGRPEGREARLRARWQDGQDRLGFYLDRPRTIRFAPQGATPL